MNNKMFVPPKWWKHSVEPWTQLTNHFDNRAITYQGNWLSISNGQSNTNYQLKIQKEFFFIQVINSHNHPLLPSLQTIRNFHHNFSQSNLSPWLVDCHLATDNLRVYSWFENDIVNNALFNKPIFIESLINFLVNLHQTPICENTRIIAIDIKDYLSNYKRQALIKSSNKQKEIEVLYKSAIQYSSKFNVSGLCHNDLSYGNLLCNQQHKLKIIDWEYACYSDPVMDLASLILNCQLNKQQESLLIQSYSQASNNAIDKNKLCNMKQLYQVISKLWFFAQN